MSTYDIPEQYHNKFTAEKTKHNDLVRKLGELKQDVSITETELNLNSQKFSKYIREIVPELRGNAFVTDFEKFEVTKESNPPFIFY